MGTIVDECASPAPFICHIPPEAWSLHEGSTSPTKIVFDVPSDTWKIPIGAPSRQNIPETWVGSKVSALLGLSMSANCCHWLQLPFVELFPCEPIEPQ